MKPKEIKKQIDRVIDLIQEDIEDCKNRNNFDAYANYISALRLMKTAVEMAREEVIKNIKE